MFLGELTRATALGLMLGTVAIAGCGSMTHSMDVKGGGHGDTDRSSMEHGGMEHGSDRHDGASHGSDHSADDLTQAGHGHGGMHHGQLEIPQGQPVPQLELVVEPDSMRGWNLKLEVSNFDFAPERVNQASVVTEGHAHLFINDEKITRLYGPWYYIPSLPVGEHELRVELNGNGHEILTTGGEPIEATVKIEVPAASE